MLEEQDDLDTKIEGVGSTPLVSNTKYAMIYNPFLAVYRDAKL
jgi:hypothetical protein